MSTTSSMQEGMRRRRNQEIVNSSEPRISSDLECPLPSHAMKRIDAIENDRLACDVWLQVAKSPTSRTIDCDKTAFWTKINGCPAIAHGTLMREITMSCCRAIEVVKLESQYPKTNDGVLVRKMWAASLGFESDYDLTTTDPIALESIGCRLGKRISNASNALSKAPVADKVRIATGRRADVCFVAFPKRNITNVPLCTESDKWTSHVDEEVAVLMTLSVLAYAR